MTLSIIKNTALGLAAVPIIEKASNLQQFEKGRVHYADEVISRISLITLVKNFYNITLRENEQSLLSTKKTLATISIPCVLALLKSSYASHYINPQIVSIAIRIEKYTGKLCYMASVINAVALISFGHLIIGYTALTVFALDLITSSTFIQSHIPSFNKTRIIFVKYISPFAELTAGLATRGYLTIGLALFGLYALFSEEYHKTITRAIETPPSIKSLEDFKNLWNDLQQPPSNLCFEMNRERVPQIQIPRLDPSQYPPSKILEIFDTIHWGEDFEKSLWNRVTGIAESDPKKVFKDLENANLEKKAHRQIELPRAKKMAREWLQAVLDETTKQDLAFFKQHICKMLLEHKDLLEKNPRSLEENQKKQSHDLFKGLLTLIFGSGGECHVAQDMKIKEAYLEIYKASNKEANQSPFLLMLELAYKNTTEQAFKDILNPILQKTLESHVQQAKIVVKLTREELRKNWKEQPSSICQLALSAVHYLLAERQLFSCKTAQETLDLNSVHNFTRVARLFGKPFNIASETDEVAERTFSSIAMNPTGSGFAQGLNLYIPLSLGKFYWDVQLEKIIQPWLITHFKEQAYFQLNDLTQWFHNSLEGFRTDSNTEEIDTMQEELQKIIPEVNGVKLAKYERKGNGNVLIPTTQALLAFAYGINLLKKKDPNTPSFFNHIDQELRVTENKDFDFTGIEKITQRIPFIPENIREKINDPFERAQITGAISRFRKDLTQNIEKDVLFFA
ncbi:hypothetical protein [Candidatus Rhabdochlamydia sp. T3358]|uniref:hypothetical protein n=1 Tax=Candidatus Rhabdochlamydia sp. T3358 TaxID=2099795 RepID=UPI0010B81B9A|nr:hypothetical protein [Candidatus Rhabdochlamydia sp. T3358]VHN99631.1 hypothetical protein RHT_00082 [Candidatus Rhabdochlamydia sp. T3358]